MSTEYTPTTEQVREDFAYPWEGFPQDRAARLAAFDRWLTEYDRAGRAEARLARVTDDSMIERLARAMHESYCDEPEKCGESDEWWLDEAKSSLALIRAVAADEQGHDALRSLTKKEALNELADALEGLPGELPHRLCDQGCKDNQQGIEHCFNCREEWPCRAAGEQEVGHG